jgi:hypothetical protein
MRPDLDEWALDGAEWMSRRSKDPSHKVGAIVLRPDGTLAGVRSPYTVDLSPQQAAAYAVACRGDNT